MEFLYAAIREEPNADDPDRDISEAKWFGNFPKLRNVVTEHRKCETPTERSSKQWIANNYFGARGYELTHSNPGVLPLLWRGQSQNWEKVAEDFLKSIIFSVHRFIFNLLGHVCPDHRIRAKLFEFIHDQILSKYKLAVREVEFLLKVERFGKMITKNHYFADTLKNTRRRARMGRRNGQLSIFTRNALMDPSPMPRSQKLAKHKLPSLVMDKRSKTFTRHSWITIRSRARDS